MAAIPPQLTLPAMDPKTERAHAVSVSRLHSRAELVEARGRGQLGGEMGLAPGWPLSRPTTECGGSSDLSLWLTAAKAPRGPRWLQFWGRGPGWGQGKTPT